MVRSPVIVPPEDIESAVDVIILLFIITS